jgi:hypothetical protein
VAAFVAAVDWAGPGTWNIGTGSEVTVLDLAALAGEISGRPFAVEFAATPLADAVAAVCQWIKAGEHNWRFRAGNRWANTPASGWVMVAIRGLTPPHPGRMPENKSLAFLPVRRLKRQSFR